MHKRYFREFRIAQRVGDDEDAGKYSAHLYFWSGILRGIPDPPRASCFLHRRLANDDFIRVFSCAGFSTSRLKGRAIVTHRRTLGIFDWRCSKDPCARNSTDNSCAHIKIVNDLFPSSIHGLDVEGSAGVPKSHAVEDLGVSFLLSLANSDLDHDIHPFPVWGPGQTISYLPIRVPLMCRLSTDEDLYADPPLLRDPEGLEGTVFTLTASSSCPCSGNHRSLYDTNATTKTWTRSCRLYTIHGVAEVEVEVQTCPVCPGTSHRVIGPDLREHGVFNYNNSALATHELLDEYTSAYTGSETPFTAWVQDVSRRYRRGNFVFMGEDLFRSIWFSYVSLISFGNDLKCRDCGDAPETVIWDGVSISFGRKKVKTTLQPPALINTDSITRHSTKYYPNQQFLEKRKLRADVRKVLKPPDANKLMDDIVEDDWLSSPTKPSNAVDARIRQAKLVKDHLDRLESVALELEAISPALAAFFTAHWTPLAYASSTPPSEAAKNLLDQVCVVLI